MKVTLTLFVVLLISQSTFGQEVDNVDAETSLTINEKEKIEKNSETTIISEKNDIERTAVSHSVAPKDRNKAKVTSATNTPNGSYSVARANTAQNKSKKKKRKRAQIR